MLTAPSMCLVPEWTERVANRLSNSSSAMVLVDVVQHLNQAMWESRQIPPNLRILCLNPPTNGGFAGCHKGGVPAV